MHQVVNTRSPYEKYQVDTNPQFDIKQLYKNLQSSGSLSSKTIVVAKPNEPLSSNNRSSSNRSAKEIQQQQGLQKVTPRAESNIVTKEFLRLQIREKEQQLQLQNKQSSQQPLLKNVSSNGQKYGLKNAQSNLSSTDLASAMQKYHQYLQQTTQKPIGAVPQEPEQQKRNNSYQEKFIAQTPKAPQTNGLQISKSSGSLLNQFVTKVSQEDMSINRLNLQLTQGTLPSKIKKRGIDEKGQGSKPPTPTQKPQNLLDPKFFSSRPATSDKPQSNRFQNQQAMTQSALHQYSSISRLKQQRQSSDPQLLKKSAPMTQSALHLKPSTPTLRWNDRLHEDKQQELLPQVHGYYLHAMQKSFYKPFNEDYFSRLYRDHFYQTYQGVYFAQFLKPAEPNDLKNKKIHLKKHEAHKNKITLVFDLDETLVHCNENTTMPSDVILKIQISKADTISAGVNIRPGAIELLEVLSKHFEIIVFTASHSCYAQKVLDHLDPTNTLIQHRLFRETCCMTTGGMYTKDLRVFADRQLDQLVLIDNAAYSYAWQIDNGIPIVPYYDNKADRELDILCDYLQGMIGCKDVREYNRHHLRLQYFNDAQGPQSAFEKVFGYSID